MIQLRGYQEAALKAIADSSMTHPLVSMPCGSGKTICFAELIRRRSPGRALVLAHRDELISQAVDKLQMVAPDLAVGVVKAERNEINFPVVVASVQTLSRRGRLTEAPHFDTVVVDEGHHVVADSYRRILSHISAPLTIGFTATPMRADKKRLSDVWEGIVYQRTIWEMIAEGYLCDLRAKQVRLKGLDLSKVKTSHGDYADGALSSAMSDVLAPQAIVEAYKKYAPNRKAIAFLPSVALAQEVAERFEATGIAAGFVSGETDADARRKGFAAFTCGDIQVMSNCAVMGEGFDEPSVDCVIMARPTKSQVAYIQMAGRCSRLYPGKQDGLLLDMVGSTTEHDLVTAASWLGVSEVTAEGGVAAALQRAQSERVAGRVDAEVDSITVDLRLRKRLHWIPDGPRFLLSLGGETLAVAPAGLQWEVRILATRAALGRVIEKQVSLEYATGIAEDYARAIGAAALVAPEAKWRRDEPTPRQVELLKKWGCWREGTTKGEASDLITRRVARG